MITVGQSADGRRKPATKLTVVITTPAGTITRSVATSLVIGRHPGRGGIVIGPDDLTISAKALRVALQGRSTVVENLSTHAAIEIHGTGAVRLLEPLEELRLTSDTRIVVRGSAYQFPIDITGVRRPPSPRRARSASPTLRFLQGQRRIADTRQQALVALCLPRFDPRRWPGGPLTSPQIAEQLRMAGIPVTPKEIDNKLARLRDQIGKDHGIHIGSRDELAELAIRHGMVTMNDIEALRARQHQYSRNRSRRGVT